MSQSPGLRHRTIALFGACVALTAGVTFGATLVRADFWPAFGILPVKLLHSLKLFLPLAAMVTATVLILDLVLPQTRRGGLAVRRSLRRIEAWLRKRYKGDRSRAEFDRVLGVLRGLGAGLLAILLFAALMKVMSVSPLLQQLTDGLVAAFLAFALLLMLAFVVRSRVNDDSRPWRVARGMMFEGLIIGALLGWFL